MAVPPKTVEDIAQGGGRHYRGRRLAAPAPWRCPACGVENTGRLEDGCEKCGAGKPGRQVRQPGDPLKKHGEAEGRQGKPPAAGPRQAADRPRSSLSPAEQFKAAARGGAIDYDEVERRVARALDAHMGGGYSASERHTLYLALEVYLTAWDGGMIEPTEGLSLEATRALAARVLPDDMPATPDREAERDAEIATAETEGDGNGDGNVSDADDVDDSSDDNPDAAEARARALDDTGPGRSPSVRRRVAAPQFVDPGDRGNEDGQDDPAGDGG